MYNRILLQYRLLGYLQVPAIAGLINFTFLSSTTTVLNQILFVKYDTAATVLYFNIYLIF